MKTSPTPKASKTEERRKLVETSRTYRLTKSIARWMDRYYIDPIVGFFLPAYGDVVSAQLNLPFLYLSMLKLSSIPLTLAIIYHTLFDILVGLIPALGDLLDIFNKSYTKNSILLTGFIEDDKKIVSEINRKAIWLGILCLILCLLIYLFILLIIQIGSWIGDLGSWFIGLFLLLSGKHI